MSKIAVVGAGQMGTACASHLTRRGHQVNLWGTELDEDIIFTLIKKGEHKTLNAPVPPGINFFQADKLEEAIYGREMIIIAVISHAVGEIMQRIVPYLRDGMVIINVAKGIPEPPHLTLCDLIKSFIPPYLNEKIQVVGMGGPARAAELIRQVYTEIIFGAENEETARYCCKVTQSSKLKAKPTLDMIGVELCAAMKNTYAIGVGICQGLSEKLKVSMDNTKAALIAQAITEMSKIILPYGGKLETIMGLAGVGDLYVTVQGGRNGKLGRILGEGMGIGDALEIMKDQTVEGYVTAKGIYRLAKELEKKSLLKIREDLPFFTQLFAILYQEKSATRVIRDYWKTE